MKKDFENGFSEPDEPIDALSEEELSMLKASIEGAAVDRSKLPPHDRSDKAKFFRFIKKNKLLAVCSLFLAVVLIAGVCFGCYFGISSLIKSAKKYEIDIDGESYKLSKKDTVIGDVLYVDFRKIASATDMMLSGTESKIQFTSKNGTYVIFEDGYGYAIINGRRTDMRSATVDGRKKSSVIAYVDKDECLVPISFLQSIISPDTMRIEYSIENRTVSIQPKYTIRNGDMETKTLVYTRFTPTEWSDPPVYTYDYILDIEPYLESITSEQLLLVNRNVHLSEDYVPADLTKIEAKTDNENQQLCYDAERALYAMMLEMQAAGIEDVFVTSSYRSYKRQVDLYWNTYVDKYVGQGYSWEEAQKKASEYSARPGESEHQSGLCIDFSTRSLNDKLTTDFEKTDAYKWLSENAHKFGFILRFPKDAEKLVITGYSYEPWHFRFVGRFAATEMYYSGECLEEYLAN